MKTDNFTKVLLTSIVILLSIIVVKDIDLPPKAQADQTLGNNQKYQVECISHDDIIRPLYAKTKCVVLNTQTGIVKMLTYASTENLGDYVKPMVQLYGEKPDF